MIASLALAVALTGHSQPPAWTPQQFAVTYTVRPGDSLWSITGALTGDPDDWPQVYRDNRAIIGTDPNLIYKGERLRVTLTGRNSSQEAARVTAGTSSARYGSGHQTPAGYDPSPRKPAGAWPGGQLGCRGLETLWLDAGGAPGAAELAAAVAMAESGGAQYALSPTQDYGYWQINVSHGSLATFSAMGNARAAVIISGDGTDWWPWTTYATGAYRGRC